ncbi:hypothetical protein [Actinopolyspora mortivallis]|uniref:hypothetical protein n=1 Tax=Actinopolyspora mortivallis TaxID=33906 RepID=UPI0012EE6F85|nr:hypothetical protein [Actinopolyspora mortivallis]
MVDKKIGKVFPSIDTEERLLVLARLRGLFLAGVALVVTVSAAPAANASTSGDVPTEAKVVKVVSGGPPSAEAVTPEEYAQLAERAGDPLSTQERERAIAAAGCWSEHTWYEGQNAYGGAIWRYNQEVGWCGDGMTITATNKISTWGSTYVPGWNYKGETNRNVSYGVGWNIWEVRTQGQFCLVEYFNCIQQANVSIFQQAQADGGLYWETSG